MVASQTATKSWDCIECRGQHTFDASPEGVCPLPHARKLESITRFVIQSIEPTTHRMLVSKPVLTAHTSSQVLNVAGKRIIVPDRIARMMTEFGMLVTVHKSSDPNFKEGEEIIIPQFAGVPVYIGQETPFWIIGAGDVMARIKTRPGRLRAKVCVECGR